MVKSKLGDEIRDLRESLGLTQDQLADKAGVSTASINRIERGKHKLPRQPRAGGLALDKICRALNRDPCSIVLACFDKGAVEDSVYRRCLLEETAESKDAQLVNAAPLQRFIDSLDPGGEPPSTRYAILNAQAMAVLVALEREFSAFELLLSNQPPFILFADVEYVTEGSSSTELTREDRLTYNQMVYEHQLWSRNQLEAGDKRYEIVIHLRSMIDFLSRRSRDRATQVANDMKTLLRFPAMDMWLIDREEPLDEIEIMSKQSPPDLYQRGRTVSVQHRRVGIENTQTYQMAFMGSEPAVVADDYRRAHAIVRAASTQYGSRDVPQGSQLYAVAYKAKTAALIDEALDTAHPRSQPAG